MKAHLWHKRSHIRVEIDVQVVAPYCSSDAVGTFRALGRKITILAEILNNLESTVDLLGM